MLDINHNAEHTRDTSVNTEATFEGLLEADGLDPISPPRGAAWVIHQIDYGVTLSPEDDSDDNISEHLQAYAGLSEDGDAPEPISSGTGSTTTEQGQPGSAVSQGVRLHASRFEDPWLVHSMHAVPNLHNVADGIAGGADNVTVAATGTFKPPKPIGISSRTELDVFYTGVFPFGTSISGEETAKLNGHWTVWYEQFDLDEPVR